MNKIRKKLIQKDTYKKDSRKQPRLLSSLIAKIKKTSIQY